MSIHKRFIQALMGKISPLCGLDLKNAVACQFSDVRLSRFVGVLVGLGFIFAASAAIVHMNFQAEARPFALTMNGNTVRMRMSADVVVATAPTEFFNPASQAFPSSTLSLGQGVRSRADLTNTMTAEAGAIPLNPDRWGLVALTGGKVSVSGSSEGYHVSPLMRGGELGLSASLPSGTTPEDTNYLPMRRNNRGVFPSMLGNSSSNFLTAEQCVLPTHYTGTGLLGLTQRFSILTSLESNAVRAAKYADLVNQYARKYNLAPSLVMAIMRTESNFNPFAISSRKAMGLMQVVADTAGEEVYTFLTGLSGSPSAESLLHPETNIQYGTTYLHLLSSRYFQGVLNKKSRELCIIAAYNGGPGAASRVFGSTPEAAVAKINTMTPDEVYETLTTKMPSQESRQYVDLVLGHARNFSLQ